MNFEDCFLKGLIRKDGNSIQKIDSTIKKAKKFIDSSDFNLANEQYDAAVIMGYNAIFSLSKALLLNKGYTENSHACLIVAVRELYSSNEEIVEILKVADEARVTRHRIQYSGLDADFEMAEFVLGLAKDYFSCVKKILG